MTNSLSLHCTRCTRPVTVEYIEYMPDALLESNQHPPTWVCPHADCIGTNLIGGVRTIVSVSTGHALKLSLL